MKEFFWLMMNKPAGTICSRKDDDGRSLVYDLLPSQLPRLEAVGRLDRESTGLLLFTNHHSLGQALLRPEHRIPREYHIVTNKPLPEKAGLELESGLVLKDGLACQPISLESMPEPQTGKSYRIILSEGKHREVRRIAMHYGRRVVGLHRVRFGNLEIGNLPLGACRELLEAEQLALRNLLPESFFTLDAL